MLSTAQKLEHVRIVNRVMPNRAGRIEEIPPCSRVHMLKHILAKKLIASVAYPTSNSTTCCVSVRSARHCQGSCGDR